MSQGPRKPPEAAQYALPLAEPGQLDLFGFATARALSVSRPRQRDGGRELDPPTGQGSRLEPFLEVFDDPWEAAHFVDGSAYADAKTILSDCRRWPQPAMALIGPPKSGKTHLARIWANDIGGRYEIAGSLLSMTPEAAAALAEGPLVIDDADANLAPLHLFSIINALSSGGGPAIFVGRSPPQAWPAETTDLGSRFRGLTSVRVGEPDDELLAGVLKSVCRKRFIRLEDTIAISLVCRMASSFAAIAALADGIEKLAEIDTLGPSPKVLDRILNYAQAAASGKFTDAVED